MPRHDQNAIRAMQPALAATGCLLAVAVAVNAVVALACAAPRVGDIVAFVPSATMASGDGTRLVAHRSGRADCILDLGVLRRSGGSLVVDTQLFGDAGDFRVHWAGPRTSDDPRNCGGDVDLIVGQRELNILALAAGGWGVGEAQMPTIAGPLSAIGS
ncbi:hypothetical protein [Rhodopila sp.]|uniref:hypothetical protein n=1 Tax=Rhodopila sp. TaxID=2480087 RepID=UPI003D12C153